MMPIYRNMDSYAHQAGYPSYIPISPPFPSMEYYQSRPRNSCCNHGSFPGFHGFPQPMPSMPLHHCPVPHYPGYYVSPCNYSAEMLMPWNQGHHCCGGGTDYRVAESKPVSDVEPKGKGSSLIPVQMKGYPNSVVWIPEEYAKERVRSEQTGLKGGLPLDRRNSTKNQMDGGDEKKARDQERHFPFPIVWMPSRDSRERDTGDEVGEEANASPKRNENLPFVFNFIPTKQNGSKNSMGRFEVDDKVDTKTVKEEVREPEKSRDSGNGRKVHKKVLSETEAALRIQSAYRGFEVRRSQPLKKLKQIAKVRDEVADVQNRIESLESTSDVQQHEKQKLIIGETIMRLLLQLDTIQGLHPSLRNIRKSLAKDLVALQEKLDSLLVIEKSQPEDLSAGLVEELGKQEMQKDDDVVNNIHNVTDSSQDQLPFTTMESEHASKCEESTLSASDNNVVSEGNQLPFTTMESEHVSKCEESTLSASENNVVSEDKDIVEMSEGPEFEKAGGVQLEENMSESCSEESSNGVNPSESVLGELPASEVIDDQHAKPKMDVEQLERGDSEAVELVIESEEATSQGIVKEPRVQMAEVPIGVLDEGNDGTRQLVKEKLVVDAQECVKVVVSEVKEDGELAVPVSIVTNDNAKAVERLDNMGELTAEDDGDFSPLQAAQEAESIDGPDSGRRRSNAEKWLTEENHKLREMMERLLEEQLSVISSLSGRVKHLEKQLSRKSKFRTKHHFRRSLHP